MDGTEKKVLDMPDNIQSILGKRSFIQAGSSDTPEGEQVNVERESCGKLELCTELLPA